MTDRPVDTAHPEYMAKHVFPRHFEWRDLLVNLYTLPEQLDQIVMLVPGVGAIEAGQAKPSQAKPSQAKPSQAKPSLVLRILNNHSSRV